MIPSAVNYKRATDLNDALQALNDDSKLLAGGHSLIPAMKLRLSQPETLIDITHITALKGIEDHSDYISIGAAVTHNAIARSNLVQAACPMVATGSGMIGDVQVRNMGTIGGSIAHADPAADWPGLLIGADATILIKSATDSREVDAASFFTGFYETVLNDNEIITEIKIPKVGEAGRTSYQKFLQPASRFAVVGCAVNIRVVDGEINFARIAFTGVSECAFLDEGASQALVGQAADMSTIDAAVDASIQGRDILSDHYASDEYRLHLAKVYLRRALQEVL